jgi:hypothetical protein
MSEYQYYEFAAVDRPLSAADREQLRAISSRARITATGFVNAYNFGNLKADPLKLLSRYFDLFLYVANWGTRWFAMRVPKRLIDVQTLKRFHLDDAVALIRPAGEHVIISVTRDEVEDEEWDDGSGHLAALAPLRAELLAGDLRLFSLLWLLQLENGSIPEKAGEPAPGLGQLSGPLAALAEFLAVDPDLLEAASRTAGPLPAHEPSPSDIEAFVRALPDKDKVALLSRLYRGDDPHLSAELRRRFQKARAPIDIAGPRRTAGELRAAARRIAEERARIAEERASAERRRRQEREARERKERLSALAKRGEAAWHEVEDLIGLRNASAYDQATTLIVDLGRIADDGGEHDMFARRLAELHRRHERKRQFIVRLREIGLESRDRPARA